MSEKFYDATRDEQETTFNVDFSGKTVQIYTSRKNVYDRLVEKLGEPTTKYYTNKKVSGRFLGNSI